MTPSPNTYHSPREGSKRAREALEHNLPAGAFEQLQCGKERTVKGRLRKARPFKWFAIRPLWISRNDRIAHSIHDPVADMRRRWMKRLGEKTPVTDTRLTIDHARDDGKTSFLVVGDPGEGDASQCVTIPPLLAAGADTDFMVICSDVVYPTGDVNEYVAKHFEVYQGYDRPIYAIPGNHDWYDELEGFMHHMCGVDPPEKGFKPVEMPGLARLLWRRPRKRQSDTDAAARKLTPPERRAQPAPYFAVDTGPVVVVGIDTGISGDLDRDQGDWLLRVSAATDKPKILLTGKPLYVDGEYHPGRIEHLNVTIDDVVRERSHRYVAAIGGDIHNYQRYPVRLEDGRVIEYIVAGGGGAFMHATHRIGRVDLGGVTEDGTDPNSTTGDGFRCFPLRGASLHFYTRVVRKELRRLLLELLAGFLGFTAATAGVLVAGAPDVLAIEAAVVCGIPVVAIAILVRYLGKIGALDIALRNRNAALTIDEASTWVAGELDRRSSPDERSRTHSTPTITIAVPLSPEKAKLAELIYPRFQRTRGFLHAFFSEIFDIDDPPLYKQFLRVDASPSELQISCFAAIGTETAADAPALEDQVTIPL